MRADFFFLFSFCSLKGRTLGIWKFVPRLGVESEMQLTVNATATATSMSATYTTTYRTVRSLTQWARLGIKSASSWICQVCFHSAIMGIPRLLFFSRFLVSGKLQRLPKTTHLCMSGTVCPASQPLPRPKKETLKPTTTSVHCHVSSSMDMLQPEQITKTSPGKMCQLFGDLCGLLQKFMCRVTK